MPPAPIPPMPLTHFDIQNAKSAAKPYKLADSGGLFLLIQPNGSRLWRLKYRHHGVERSLSFGPYPTVSLAEARSKRDEAKKLMSEGVDCRPSRRGVDRNGPEGSAAWEAWVVAPRAGAWIETYRPSCHKRQREGRPSRRGVDRNFGTSHLRAATARSQRLQMRLEPPPFGNADSIGAMVFFNQRIFINYRGLPSHFDSAPGTISLPVHRPIRRQIYAVAVTGANFRARTCSRDDAASAMLNTINNLKGRRLAVNITFEPLAREFAPITCGRPRRLTSGVFFGL
jgi:hypothetical protein